MHSVYLPMQHLVVCHLDHLAYEPAWKLQKRIQAKLIQAKRQTPAVNLPHVFLLVEHPHVYTLGKNGKASNLLLNETALAAIGATFIPIDRGGDITYHGPGQLVGYTILDLERFSPDLHRYMRNLEEVIIRTCADYGLTASRFKGRTGVWIGPDAKGPERKICAMGLRCSRWVTMHGFAFNLNTDLHYFDYIIPCGITDRGVTSLARELGRPVDEAEVRNRVRHHFEACFQATSTTYNGIQAHAFLASYLETYELSQTSPA